MVSSSSICILPSTLTRSNSLKFGGNWKFIKAAQWNTQSTPSNAFPISFSVGSQMSPTNDVTGFVSTWPGEMVYGIQPGYYSNRWVMDGAQPSSHVKKFLISFL